MHSHVPLVLALHCCGHRSVGSPSSPSAVLSTRACPLSPRKVSAIALVRCFIAGGRLQLIRQIGHSLLTYVLTRPNRVRLRYGSRVRACEAPPAGLLPLTLAGPTCCTDNW